MGPHNITFAHTRSDIRLKQVSVRGMGGGYLYLCRWFAVHGGVVQGTVLRGRTMHVEGRACLQGGVEGRQGPRVWRRKTFQRDDTTRGHVGTRPSGTEMNKTHTERERERETERQREKGTRQGKVTPCVYRERDRERGQERKSRFSLVLMSLSL